MEYAGYDYTEIALDDCFALAMTFVDAGSKWHSHVLSPGCRLNPFPKSFAIVLEDNTNGVTYIAASDGFPEVDKQLVKILHGDDILDESKTLAGAAQGQVASPLLARVMDLNRRGVPWHHHMNFPDCVFNPQKGSWAITVESGSDIQFHETYDDEPKDILRELEVLYFRNL